EEGVERRLVDRQLAPAEPLDRPPVQIHRDDRLAERGPADARDDAEVRQAEEPRWAAHVPPSRGATAAAITVRESQRSLSQEPSPAAARASKCRRSAAHVGSGPPTVSRPSSGTPPGSRRPHSTSSLRPYSGSPSISRAPSSPATSI